MSKTFFTCTRCCEKFESMVVIARIKIKDKVIARIKRKIVFG